jgi:hypothetical protein
MVVFKPEPVVVTDKLSADLMWLFVRAGRCSFTEFVENFGEAIVAEFLRDLDEAGLCVASKGGGQ